MTDAIRSYEQVVQRLAERAFSIYMGGSNESRLYGIDVGLVGFIYGKTNSAVGDDIDAAFEHISVDYYLGVRK